MLKGIMRKMIYGYKYSAEWYVEWMNQGGDGW